jgi:ABC-type multidrug transport system ATPase subunit
MTTHYMEEAEALCDRLAIMDHGKILDSGTADELIGRRFRERTVRFDRPATVDEPALGALSGVTRVVVEHDQVVLHTNDVARTIAGLLELTSRAGTEPANLMIRRASLEDVFLELTGHALRD